MRTEDETVLLVYEKKKPGLRILMEAAEPASIGTIDALMRALQEDPRCGEICILANNIARDVFESEIRSGVLKLRKINGEGGIIENIPGPFDVGVAIVGPQNSPAQLLLYSAKSVFGCRKLFFISGGLPGTVIEILNSQNSKNMDPVDALLVEDEFVAHLYRIRLPQINPNRIIPTGTALTDEIRDEEGVLLRESGRVKLGIEQSSKTLFYSSFPGSDYERFGGSVDIALHTLAKTLAGAKQAAEDNKESRFVVIVRLHPRTSAEENRRQLSLCEGVWGENLRVIGDTTAASYKECLYATDIIGCMPTSTLASLSHYRGQKALLFAYSGKGQSEAMFERLSPGEERKVIAQIPGVVVVHSQDEIAREFGKADRIRPSTLPKGNSTVNILAQIF